MRQIPIMNASFLKELQELVKANVISQQTADDIYAFYQSKKLLEGPEIIFENP